MTVTVTSEMLDAAMKKAVEAGLLPRCARREDTLDYQDLIRHVIHAALEADASAKKQCICRMAMNHNEASAAFVDTSGAVCLTTGYIRS